MEDLKKLSNNELIEMIGNLCDNHEKLKQEILILHEVLQDCENEYLLITSELKTRI